MNSWRWLLAALEVVLILVLVLLWIDTLRQKPGWQPRRAATPWAVGVAVVPIGVGGIVLGPWWLGLGLVALPGLIVLTMALAS